jgi:hypothetical protein
MEQAYSGQAAVDTVAQRFMTSGVDGERWDNPRR